MSHRRRVFLQGCTALGTAGAARVLTGVCVGAALATMSPRAALAAGKVTIVLAVDQTEVVVGDVVTLRVEVTIEDDGSGLELSMPELPGSDALVISKRGSGVSRSMSWVNGVAQSQTIATHTYLVEPQEPGRFELDVTVRAGGETYHAEEIPVLVVTGDAVVSAVRRDARSKPKTTKSDVVVWPYVDRSRVYVGQPLVYELEIWERVDARISVEQLPTFEDFFARDLPQGRERIDRIGQVPYRVHPLVRRLLVPQRAGKIAVGAPSVSVDDDDPFLLLRRRKRGGPKRVKGDAVEVEVQPLPAEGQPPGFPSGNVGAFTLAASTDKRSLAVGEAFTLTLVTEGSGDLSLGTPPALPSVEGLRFYEPRHEVAQEVKAGELVGMRTTTVLVVTQRPGTLEIPAVELPYFDPVQGAYRSARAEPIELVVTGVADPAVTAEPTEDADEVAPGDASEGTLAPLLLSTPVRWQAKQTPLFGFSRVLVGFGGVMTLSVLLSGASALARSLRTSDERRAALEAARSTRARRRAVLEAARRGRVEHEVLASLLQERARARLGPAAEGQTRGRLAAALRTAGVTDALVVRWSALLERCDAARFAGDTRGEAARAAEHARQLVDEAFAILDDAGWQDRESSRRGSTRAASPESTPGSATGRRGS